MEGIWGMGLASRTLPEAVPGPLQAQCARADSALPPWALPGHDLYSPFRARGQLHVRDLGPPAGFWHLSILDLRTKCVEKMQTLYKVTLKSFSTHVW